MNARSPADDGAPGAAGGAVDDVAAGDAHALPVAALPGERAAAPTGGRAVGNAARPVAAAAPGEASSTGASERVGADAYGPVTLTEPMLAAWGEHIGMTVAVPAFLALRGQLGAGKSVLARAVARGAGVSGHLPSPTFNLLYRYGAARGIDVVHLDLYRLEDPSEVWELGWVELGTGEEIVLAEWPERAEALLPPDRWDIWLEIPGEEATVRSVRATRSGAAPPIPPPPGPGNAA